MQNNDQIIREGDVTIHTYNVRGMKDKYKRDQIFAYLKSNHKGIYCLQETHLNGLHESQIKSVYGPNCFFSHGTNFKSGVCIIIPKGIDFQLKSEQKDDNGRYVIINGIFQGTELTIVNAYAPTQDKKLEQKVFYTEILKIIGDRLLNLIWTGDFNLYLDPELDCYIGSKKKRNATAEMLVEYMEENNIVDCWRVRNPDIKRYTWRRAANNITQQSRLDYFLISEGLMFNTTSCEIHTSFKSDHNIVSITIATDIKTKYGKGVWKFNNSLLADKEYTGQISRKIIEWEDKYTYLKDKGMKWELIKAEIRSHTIGYCSIKSKEKKAYENKLIKELKQIEVEMCCNPNANTKQLLQTTQKQLEDIERYKLQGAQLRAKCQHINEHEYNTKYFLNKEKAKSEAKSMKTLLTDTDELIKDSKIIANEQRKFYQKLYSDTCDVDANISKDAMKYFLESEIEIENINEHDK